MTPDEGTETLDQAGSETTTGTEGQTETELETEGSDGTETADSSEAEPELEDIEYGGKTYKLPKEIKPALMMNADYTRKTQEVAEQRKALETERETFKQQAEAQQKHIKDIAKVVGIDEQLKAYQDVDWQRLEAENPFEAQSALRRYTLLKDQRNTLVNQIQETEQSRAVEAQQAAAKRFEEANAALKRDIKDWDTVSGKLVEFATANGATKAELAQFAQSVPLVKLLHKAWVGEQVIQKQRAAAKAAKAESEPAPEPLKVVAKGRSAPANSGLSDNLSAEEWLKRRNAQIAAQTRHRARM